MPPVYGLDLAMRIGGRKLVITLGVVAAIVLLGAWQSFRLFGGPATVTVVGILTTSTPGPGQGSTGWIVSTTGGPVEVDVSAVAGSAGSLQLKNVTATGTYRDVNGKRVLVISGLK